MIRSRTDQLILLTFVLSVVNFLSGCSDPRFKQKQGQRDARMAYWLDAYATHDAEGTDRIDQTLALKEQLDQSRAEHLTYTSDLVQTRYDMRHRRWHEQTPLRRDRVAAYFRGKPERISDTWAKIAY